MTKSLEAFLDDSVDVILQERENRELHAGMFMVKNSDFGRRFVLVCCAIGRPSFLAYMSAKPMLLHAPKQVSCCRTG